MKKRILLLLFVTLSVLSFTLLSCISAFKSESTTTENVPTQPPVAREELAFKLNEDEKSYTVKGIGTCKGTEIVIPAEYHGKPVTGIGALAFANCRAITSIIIPDSVTSIDDRAFSYMKLKCITVDEGNPSYQSIDGNLYSKNGEVLLQYAVGKEDTSFVTPEHVTSIGNFAFERCSSLESLTLTDGITSIGERAFSDCENLRNLTLPPNLTYLGAYAFLDTSPRHVYISDLTVFCKLSVFTGTRIGDYKLYLNGELLTNLVIPSGTTALSMSAFQKCTSLTSVTVPDSVTQIYATAFSNCYNLTSIYYCGTPSRWNEIFITPFDGFKLSCTLYFYSESAPTDTENQYWRYVDGVPTPWKSN